MKSDLNAVETTLAQQNFISLEEVKNEILPNESGFYWIFTKLKIDEFLKAPKPVNYKHVNFSQLSKVHEGLVHIISQNSSNYWCIYNGKGKQLKNRIVAEFSNTKGPTGTLALTRCFSSSDFKIKYVVCNSPTKSKGVTHAYDSLQRDLERVWRLENGWPLLCRT